MPVHKTKDGKYQYGETGKKYSSKKDAIKQALAIAYSRAKREGKDKPSQEEVRAHISGNPDKMKKTAAKQKIELSDGSVFEYNDRDKDSAEFLEQLKNEMQPISLKESFKSSIPTSGIAAAGGALLGAVIPGGSIGGSALASGIGTMVLNMAIDKAQSRQRRAWEVLSAMSGDGMPGKWRLTADEGVWKNAAAEPYDKAVSLVQHYVYPKIKAKETEDHQLQFDDETPLAPIGEYHSEFVRSGAGRAAADKYYNELLPMQAKMLTTESKEELEKEYLDYLTNLGKEFGHEQDLDKEDISWDLLKTRGPSYLGSVVAGALIGRLISGKKHRWWGYGLGALVGGAANYWRRSSYWNTRW